MTRHITIFLLILAVSSIYSQNRKNWTELDYLNFDDSYPFEAETDITGIFFVTISDTLNYYAKPII